MVFVTIGTSEPFDRLLQSLEAIDDDLVVQSGDSQAVPERALSVAYMSYEELVEHVRRARAVVSHAGVGTILTVLAQGKRPVVVARRQALGEAVDDHQVVLAQRLGELGVVVNLEDLSQIGEFVGRLSGEERAPRLGSSPLVGEIRSLVEAHVLSREP